MRCKNELKIKKEIQINFLTIPGKNMILNGIVLYLIKTKFLRLFIKKKGSNKDHESIVVEILINEAKEQYIKMSPF